MSADETTANEGQSNTPFIYLFYFYYLFIYLFIYIILQCDDVRMTSIFLGCDGRQSSRFDIKSWQEVCSFTKIMHTYWLLSWLLSRKVGANLPNIHPILMLWKRIPKYAKMLRYHMTLGMLRSTTLHRRDPTACNLSTQCEWKMNVFDVLKLTHFTINQELMNHPSYIVTYMSQQRGHRLIDILSYGRNIKTVSTFVIISSIILLI